MEGALRERFGGKSALINRRNLIILAAIVALLLAAYVLISRMTQAPAAAAIQTQPARIGNLTATVSTAGNIVPAQEVNLNFKTAGEVKMVNVKMGDRVKAGDVLAALDTTELELQVANARAALTVAEAKLAQTKAGPTAEKLAAAQATVKSAEENLAKVKAGPTAAEIAAAQAQVKAAQDNYNTVAGKPEAEAVQEAKLKLDQAKNSLWSTQASRDAISGRGGTSPEAKDQAKASVANAEIAVQLAEQVYADAQKPATTQELQTALAQLKTAQTNLANLYPTKANIAAAESQLTQAQSSLAELTEGATSQDLAIAQAGVDQAKIALRQAEMKQDDAQFIAPFDATVASVGIEQGLWSDTGGSEAAISLADTSNLEIQGQFAEVDVVKVKEGQEAEITLDALPDLTLRGKVTEISPVGTVSQGVVNYLVTISLIDPDPAVKPGMTANVNVIVDERQNALLVPNRAIKSQNGGRYVTVLYKGQRIQTPVQIGLASDSMTEITGGLKEGDEVVVSGITTTSTGQGNRIMMGGGMPGGGIPGGGPPPP